MKTNHYQKEPIFAIPSIANQEKKEVVGLGNLLLKEKINKLSSMVEEYMKYKQNKKKNMMNLEQFQKKFYANGVQNMSINENLANNQTNHKNSKGKKKIVQKFLDKNDNYFESDEDLYNYYGAIPHFLSYNS